MATLMGGVRTVIMFLFLSFLGFPNPTASEPQPLCTNSRAPFNLSKPLAFCPYNGSTCCNSTQDTQLQKQFQALKVSDTSCAAVLKSVLCATCDPFSSQLYTIKTEPRSVPVLCNSTVSADDYCSTVWDTCMNVSMKRNPFAPASMTPTISSSIADLWRSKPAFCNSFGGASTVESVCFNGKPVTLNVTDSLTRPAPVPSGASPSQLNRRVGSLMLICISLWIMIVGV